MRRLASLDAFRGFAIASMVLVNNPGDWTRMYAPFGHAKWNGWTFTDLVFPFFLFAVGVAMALSIQRRPPQLLRRAGLIFLIGLALNFIPAFDPATVRIPGVLQRIALCILVATPIALHASTRWVAAAILLLFAIYSAPMLLVGALEPGQDFGAMIDRAVLGGHLWAATKTWDPEGLWSTLPAVGSVLFGVLAGRHLLAGGNATKLFVAGLVALAAGWILDAVFMPINKNLWTPSYTVFMTGWSLVAFAAFHATIEKAPRFFQPFVIFGMNALFIFALSGLIGRILVIPFGDWPTNAKALLYAPLRSLPLSPEGSSLLYAIGFELAMFAVAWVLWKKGWFVRV